MEIAMTFHEWVQAGGTLAARIFVIIVWLADTWSEICAAVPMTTAVRELALQAPNCMQACPRIEESVNAFLARSSREPLREC